MKFLHSVLAKLFGFNFSFTPKEVIIDQLNEPRPLPMGRSDFSEWSDRIIRGALVPNEDGLVVGTNLKYFPEDQHEKINDNLKVFEDSQKFCLANLLMHLGPTESHKPDAFFIHSLRKFAVNQVADTIRIELREAAKARTAKDEKSGGDTQGTSEVLVQAS